MTQHTEQRAEMLDRDAGPSTDAARRRLFGGMLGLTVRINAELRLHHEFSTNSEVIALISLRLSGVLRARDLTARTGMTRAGTTNLIDRLENASIVRRLPVVDDHRGVAVELTDDGLRRIDAMVDGLTSVFVDSAQEFATWADDLEELGIRVGPLQLPTGGVVKRLDYVRRVAGAGAHIMPLYAEAFGPDVAHPHLLLFVLLLADETGGTRPSTISEVAMLQSASTSDLLAHAETLQLVTRRRGAAPDRRATIVEITDRGRAALDHIIARSDPVMRFVADTFFASPS